MKNMVKIILASALGGIITLGAYKLFLENPRIETIIQSQPSTVMHTGLTPMASDANAANSFTEAAEKSVNSVVHVTTALEENDYQAQSPFDFFFGSPYQNPQPREAIGSGSGVIISADGYIVTNNHVIENTKKIQVTLNNGEEYDATVVGSDPTTDIGLIKIDPKEKLPFLTFSNSDNVKLGEWVLAVGNPFNLTSTVTAGIVSAKSRNIGIINQRTAIESFIQTDAAVNPGNSGGALVNTAGELVGINSAISTHTGTYEGYSFAIPSNIVKKVIEDLLEYGNVQRAFIGVNISDVTPRIEKEMNINRSNGVYVQSVTEDGAAEDAGIKSGDVIIAVDGHNVAKSSELQEYIGRKRPGDKVTVTVDRDGDTKDFEVELRNINGTTKVVKKEDTKFINLLGADLKAIGKDKKAQLGVTFGVEVKNLQNGILAEAGIPEGFVITYVNRKEIHEPDDINKAVKGLAKGDPVVIQGYTPDGRSKYFAFGY